MLRTRATLIPSMQTIILFLAFFCAGSVVLGADVYIGNGVFLPETDLGTALNPLLNIFEGNISAFLREERFRVIRNQRTFMHSSDSIHHEFGTSFDVGGPIKVLQLSFGTSVNRITGNQRNVTASLVHVESYSKRLFLRTEVPTTLTEIPLRQAFLSELRALPEPPIGALASQWTSYRSFLRRWGSHYVTNIFYGSWLRQWSSAASTLRYTQRQVEARACAQLRGTANVPSINGCLGFTSAEITNSLALNMQSSTEVRGGDPGTASAIAIQRTEALVTRFIQEGATSDNVVRYSFTPVWVPVKARFGSSNSKERRVATALEAYYNGFLAFNCPRQVLSRPANTIMQEFRRKGGAMTYQCVRACVGCRQNRDCTYNGWAIGCWCYGESCVAALGPDGRAIVQTNRDRLGRSDLPNRSCEYSWGQASCLCNTRSKEPFCNVADNTFVIWDQTIGEPSSAAAAAAAATTAAAAAKQSEEEEAAAGGIDAAEGSTLLSSHDAAAHDTAMVM